MKNFEVWAPLAKRVDLVLDGKTVPMDDRGDGWWRPEHPVDWVADLDYGYRLDGGDAVLPDPRSVHQPHGVHGLSRTVDLGAHPWTDGGWLGRTLEGGIIYELHVGTFTAEGTLDAAVERLDHLVELGVTFVELMPMNAVNGTHNWGYDGVLWFAVHEPYGGPAAYQRFVDAAHSRGIGVLQDVVYNHLGPSGNYLPQFGTYLGESSTGWGAALNLDGEGSRHVRDYILDNAEFWLRDLHVDGLRLDAVHALEDRSDIHLLTELSSQVDDLADELERPLILIAESDLNDPVMITARDAGGRGLTAQWNDDYHHAAHVALTGETAGYYADFDSLAALAKTITSGFFHDGTYSSFRERIHGRPLDADTSAWRLVTYTQNHDQIGNRAAGDRLSQTLDPDSLGLQAVLTMLTPFTPMIFMGEEWAASTPWQFFTSHPEHDLGAAVAEGRVAEFAAMGWDPELVPDPQDPQTRARSVLDWAELSQPGPAAMLGLYRRLAQLRAELPGLRDPHLSSIQCTFDEDRRWLRIDRPGVSIVLNFSGERRSIPAGTATLALATHGDTTLEAGMLELAPRSAAVVAGGVRAVAGHR
jgi:maltooligosyltrehalose trehalohydrolase